MAPERCPVCEWTNIHLMNYGQSGAPKWMCHGCAARGLAERDTLRASLEQVTAERDEWKRQHDNAVACWREEVARFVEQRDSARWALDVKTKAALAALDQRDSAIADRDRLAKEAEGVAGVVRAAKSWRVYVDTIGADETSDEEWDLRRAVDALATTGGSDV